MKPRSALFHLRRISVAAWAFILSASAATEVTFQPAAARVPCHDFLEVTLNITGSTAANPFTDAMVTGTFRIEDAVDCTTPRAMTFLDRYATASKAAMQARTVSAMRVGRFMRAEGREPGACGQRGR